LLEPLVRQALAGLPPQVAARVTNGLVITGGEAFWEEDWHPQLSPPRCRQVLNCLTAAGIVEEVGRRGDRRQLQVKRRWLQI
jgi:hypothetical protein